MFKLNKLIRLFLLVVMGFGFAVCIAFKSDAATKDALVSYGLSTWDKLNSVQKEFVLTNMPDGAFACWLQNNTIRYYQWSSQSKMIATYPDLNGLDLTVTTDSPAPTFAIVEFQETSTDPRQVKDWWGKVKSGTKKTQKCVSDQSEIS